jgi:hypothetical protein
LVIKVLDVVPRCYTWDDGATLAEAIRQAWKAEDRVTVSFAGVDVVPSSFVNGAFVDLLNDVSFDELKRKLKIIDSNRAINDVIRRRLEFEANRWAVA